MQVSGYTGHIYLKNLDGSDTYEILDTNFLYTIDEVKKECEEYIKKDNLKESPSILCIVIEQENEFNPETLVVEIYTNGKWFGPPK